MADACASNTPIDVDATVPDTAVAASNIDEEKKEKKYKRGLLKKEHVDFLVPFLPEYAALRKLAPAREDPKCQALVERKRKVFLEHFKGKLAEPAVEYRAVSYVVQFRNNTNLIGIKAHSELLQEQNAHKEK